MNLLIIITTVVYIVINIINTMFKIQRTEDIVGVNAVLAPILILIIYNVVVCIIP